MGKKKAVRKKKAPLWKRLVFSLHDSKKKGISNVVAVVLLILIIVLGVALIWLIILPLIDDWFAAAEVTAVLTTEKLSIPWVGMGGNDTTLAVEITRGKTDLMTIEVENITTLVTRTEYPLTDVLLLVDLSGSMKFLVGYDCVKGVRSLNYSGSYCDSSPGVCTGACGGDAYVADVCINASSNQVKSCTDSYDYVGDQDSCTSDCLGAVDGGYLPIDILKVSAKEFVSSVLENENISIALMGFGGDRFPYEDFTDNVSDLIDEIDTTWIAKDGTPLLQGMTKSYNNFTIRPSEINKSFLIVLGDGAASSGSDSDFKTISNSIYNEDVEIHSIGFGPNVDADLFELIAAEGGGLYHNSSDFLGIAEVFKEIFTYVNNSYLVEESVSMRGVFMDIAIFAGGSRMFIE